MRISFLWPIVALLQATLVSSFSLLPRASNSSDSSLAASSSQTFLTQFGEPDQNFTFTLTANANGDLWFRLAGPSHWSWIAVGTGNEMTGSLMFIVYPNTSGG
jgi:hypothetical protein